MNTTKVAEQKARVSILERQRERLSGAELRNQDQLITGARHELARLTRAVTGRDVETR
jgi:hypothetical protein